MMQCLTLAEDHRPALEALLPLIDLMEEALADEEDLDPSLIQQMMAPGLAVCSGQEQWLGRVAWKRHCLTMGVESEWACGVLNEAIALANDTGDEVPLVELRAANEHLHFIWLPVFNEDQGFHWFLEECRQ